MSALGPDYPTIYAGSTLSARRNVGSSASTVIAHADDPLPLLGVCTGLNLFLAVMALRQRLQRLVVHG